MGCSSPAKKFSSKVKAVVITEVLLGAVIMIGGRGVWAICMGEEGPRWANGMEDLTGSFDAGGWIAGREEESTVRLTSSSEPSVASSSITLMGKSGFSIFMSAGPPGLGEGKTPMVTGATVAVVAADKINSSSAVSSTTIASSLCPTSVPELSSRRSR